METPTTPKRPRGRPRSDAAPRPDIHVRVPPDIKEQLEREAKRTKRSVANEFVAVSEKAISTIKFMADRKWPRCFVN